MWALAIVAGVVVVLILYVAYRGRYYRAVFSEENFREFHEKLSAAISQAQRKSPGEPPSPNDGTGFTTRAGLAVGVTWKCQEGVQAVHLSLSQVGQVTTRAVCSRFGFFTIVMFEDLKAELSPFYTNSGVHHLLFRFPAGMNLLLRNFDATFARYSNDYRPIPFRHEQKA
jgi:hypothetical protein